MWKCGEMRRLASFLTLAVAAQPCAVTAQESGGAPVAVHFLTRDSASADYWPCFSPDGRTVLFSRSADGGRTWNLFVVPASGGEAHALSVSPLPVSATRAAWSQQNLIAFTGTSPDGKNTVWLVNADGTHPRQVTATGLSERVFYPSWYPDGRSLAVMDAAAAVIMRIDLQRLTTVRVTNHDQVLTGMPSVSPDGRWIAFAGQANVGVAYDQTRNSIWVVSDTGAARTVEAAPGQGRTPSWSPDGRWLAFESNRGSNSDQLYAIFIINRDGNGLRQITPYELSANHPVWSSDGNRLVFSARQAEGRPTTGIAVLEVTEPNPRPGGDH